MNQGHIMSIPNENRIDQAFMRRWICLVHVAPPKIAEYADDFSADIIGAYVPVVADAVTEKEFVDKVKKTLEVKMGFPIHEIEDIEPLSSCRKLGKDLQDSIDNLLPQFPIAFGDFQCHTGLGDENGE